MIPAPSSLLAGLLAVALVAGCAKDDPPAAEPRVRTSAPEDANSADPETDDAAHADARDAALAAELEAYEAAEPVFERHCARCHDPEGPRANAAALRHFSMEGYPFGGHHAHELGKIIPRVVGAGEHDATMPKDDPGALGEDELERIVEWAEAHERARAAGARPDGEPAGHRHDHGGHDHGGHDH